METPFWLESCEHTDCFPQRFEYCAQELENSGEEVSDIVEAVEDLMHSPTSEYSGIRYFGHPNGESERTRDFTVLQAGDNEYQTVNSCNTLTVHVAHHKHPTRTIYTIVDEWHLANGYRINETMTRLYTFEIYASGATQLTVTEASPITFSPADRKYEDRPMTPYDIGELHKLLNSVQQSARIAANE